VLPTLLAGGGGGGGDDEHEPPVLETSKLSLGTDPSYSHPLSPRRDPYTHAAPEKVGEAFQQSSFNGIRSLPNSQFGSSNNVAGKGGSGGALQVESS
jgi:hypothetical protein